MSGGHRGARDPCGAVGGVKIAVSTGKVLSLVSGSRTAGTARPAAAAAIAIAIAGTLRRLSQ
jgi:hypothetical protein